MAETCAALAWDYAPFEIPSTIRDAWDARARGAEQEQTWQGRQAYQESFPDAAAALQAGLNIRYSDAVAKLDRSSAS